ncbi:ExbD/TolR family protein [Aridibaculum aurantiacum]|uniref:ExbD/TolR family protein n=1 Tax=Aridibaculum aurantiacum TaxID=2810307 RepID=UPI001A968786|nr:biopolymer transporter ExbD [Aridibaculum aurantiacum]
MARPKLPRKSTSVDMTAMCDVAFLLLSFFILTTKFKPSETVAVTTPSSVSSKVAPEKDVTLVSFTKDGKVFLSLDNKAVKEEMARQINSSTSVGLTPEEVELFKDASLFGTSVGQLKSFLRLPKEQLNGQALPGIPAQDTANNEMVEWMRYVVLGHAAAGERMNLLIKGDNLAKYPTFKNVIDAFKKNDQFKFQMITNPEGVPEGTDLWKRFMQGGKISED